MESTKLTVKVIIPRTENTIRCKSLEFIESSLFLEDINSELDELDREDFYRLKKVRQTKGYPSPLLTERKVKNNKQRDIAAADRENAAKRRSSDKENAGEPEGAASKDVLGNQEDQDVIF